MHRVGEPRMCAHAADRVEHRRTAGPWLMPRGQLAAVNTPAGGRKLTGDPVIVLARHPRLSAGQLDAVALTAVQKNPRLGRSRVTASVISSAVLSASAASATLALSVG